jgi:hypothetical protein
MTRRQELVALVGFRYKVTSLTRRKDGNRVSYEAVLEEHRAEGYIVPVKSLGHSPSSGPIGEEAAWRNFLVAVDSNALSLGYRGSSAYLGLSRKPAKVSAVKKAEAIKMAATLKTAKNAVKSKP